MQFQPIITGDPPRNRPFATSAVALQALVFNAQKQVLLISSPTRRPDGWQVVSGALEAGETLLNGVLREAREELGPAVRLRPLGVVHAQTFHYDSRVQFAIGIYYLCAYLGGEVVPGDDMAGSDYGWWDVEDLEGAHLHPSTHVWMLRRAAAVYDLWHAGPDQPLQPAL